MTHGLTSRASPARLRCWLVGGVGDGRDVSTATAFTCAGVVGAGVAGGAAAGVGADGGVGVDVAEVAGAGEIGEGGRGEAAVGGTAAVAGCGDPATGGFWVDAGVGIVRFAGVAGAGVEGMDVAAGEVALCGVGVVAAGGDVSVDSTGALGGILGPPLGVACWGVAVFGTVVAFGGEAAVGGTAFIGDVDEDVGTAAATGDGAVGVLAVGGVATVAWPPTGCCGVANLSGGCGVAR